MNATRPQGRDGTREELKARAAGQMQAAMAKSEEHNLMGDKSRQVLRQEARARAKKRRGRVAK